MPITSRLTSPTTISAFWQKEMAVMFNDSKIGQVVVISLALRGVQQIARPEGARGPFPALSDQTLMRKRS